MQSGASRASNQTPRPNRGPRAPTPQRPPMPSQMSTWEPMDPQGSGLQSSPIDDRLRPELEAPLTKRQLKVPMK